MKKVQITDQETGTLVSFYCKFSTLQPFQSVSINAFQYILPQAIRILEDLISDLCLNFIFEEHRQSKTTKTSCQICLTPCRNFPIPFHENPKNNNSGEDIYGNNSKDSTERFECPSCKMSYPNGRYAPHLEKCLGLGRTSRAAFKRQV